MVNKLENYKLNKTISLVFLAAACGFATSGHAQDGDATLGEEVFKKCSACHTIGDNVENKVGPNLTGVIGRKAGSLQEFAYGKSLLSAGESGLVWTEDEVFDYLLHPTKYLRAKLNDKKAKSKMPFKLKDKDARRNVIEYLKSLSPED